MVSVRPQRPRNGPIQQLAPVLAIISMALVAAVAVILIHSPNPVALIVQGAPPPMTINGIKYVAVPVPAGSPILASMHAVPAQKVAVSHAKAAAKPQAVKAKQVNKLSAAYTGRYGHQAEAILTQHRGPLPAEPKGNILRGAAPPVPKLAAPTTAYGRSLQRDFVDALKDCKGDASDNCDNFLHPEGKRLAKFEHDQEQADRGLFGNFERVQHMYAVRPGAAKLPHMAHGGMLAQIEYGRKVDDFGIPYKGSLPGDNV